jgi:hypothetical protein
MEWEGIVAALERTARGNSAHQAGVESLLLFVRWEVLPSREILREEYGIHINYVRPVPWQGRKVWAIGNRLYANRPPRETFHEFILSVLRGVFGESWRVEQAALPCEKQHSREDLRSVKHVEFEATHRPSGQTFAVEAKSRHRGGIIHQPGDPREDPLHGDARSIRRLFTEALAKAPSDMAYLIFLDVNAPHTPDVDARWQSDVKSWMNRMPAPTDESRADYTALVVTNFSPQHDADEVSSGGTWLSTIPVYAADPLETDLWPALWAALDTYGSVPAFTEDGVLD